MIYLLATQVVQARFTILTIHWESNDLALRVLAPTLRWAFYYYNDNSKFFQILSFIANAHIITLNYHH